MIVAGDIVEDNVGAFRSHAQFLMREHADEDYVFDPFVRGDQVSIVKLADEKKMLAWLSQNEPSTCIYESLIDLRIIPERIWSRPNACSNCRHNDFTLFGTTKTLAENGLSFIRYVPRRVSSPDGPSLDLLEAFEKDTHTLLLCLDQHRVDQAVAQIKKAKEDRRPLVPGEELDPETERIIQRCREERAARGPHPDQGSTRMRL